MRVSPVRVLHSMLPWCWTRWQDSRLCSYHAPQFSITLRCSLASARLLNSFPWFRKRTSSEVEGRSVQFRTPDERIQMQQWASRRPQIARMTGCALFMEQKGPMEVGPWSTTKSVSVAFHGVTPVPRVNDLETSL